MDIRVIASGSSGNAYYVSDGKTPLLLDCGLSFKVLQREVWAIGLRMSDLAACLITHEHQDHCKALRDMLKAGIDCYMTNGTADNLHDTPTGHRVNLVESEKQFKIGTWRIMPFATEHDAAEPVGFLLYSPGTAEKLLYLTDSYFCRYRFNGLTHILIECNHSLKIITEGMEAGWIDLAHGRRLMQSHFSIERVKEFLAAHDLSMVREIHLIHLSKANSNPEQFRREIQQQTGKPVYTW